MIAISFEFLAGRYHATPWGRHVNEGAVEWPPSPWRILRALIATWKRTLPEIAEPEVKPILEELSAAPPEFILPPASIGHTRHYMPWFKKGPDDRTLVFDTFVALPRHEAMLVRWPNASLDAAQRETLDHILANVNTLGRAESWCEAKLLADAEAEVCVRGSPERHSVPLYGPRRPSDFEIVRLLCPRLRVEEGESADRPTAFNNTKFFEQRQKKSGKKITVQEVRTAPQYEPDWHIAAETLWLHSQRWSDPPGSRWVPYARPRDCFNIRSSAPAPIRPRSAPGPQVVRFALDSTVLPLITEVLPVAEAARRALIYRLIDVRGRQQYRNDWTRQKHKAGIQPVLLHSVLTGKDEHRKPLTGHAHAYFLPTDEDNDGRIDHLTIVARDGFDADEMHAMDRLRIITPRGRDNASHPLRVLMLGYGRLDEYRPSFLQSSREWTSATPYIATRHAKTRGRDRIELASQQQRSDFLKADLLTQIGITLPDLDEDTLAQVIVTPLWDSQCVFRVPSRHCHRELLAIRGDEFQRDLDRPSRDDPHGLRPIQFKRFRAKPGDDGGRRLAGAFRLIFPLDVQGPIVLGWSSHFGMGLFLPARSD